MGQYYYVVNVTKQQFILPCTFNDGLQICALSGNGGTLSAMAMLLASGNGKGLGDFELTYNTKLDSNPHEPKTPEYKAWKGRNRTPSPLFDIVGSWAGDQIVIAGDYGEDGKFLTEHQQQLGINRIYEERCLAARENNRTAPKKKDITCNLHKFAEWYFTDVGSAVLAVMEACGMSRHSTDDTRWEELVETFGKKYLWHAWNKDRVISTGRGKTRRHKYDLRWLPFEALDSIMVGFSTQVELVACRKWLLKQELSPLIREAVACYNLKTVDDGIIRSRGSLGEIMAKYNLPTDRLGRLEHQPLLPPKDILDAAMDVAIIAKFEKLDQPPPAMAADPGRIAQVAKRAKVHYRTRVIDIETPT